MSGRARARFKDAYAGGGIPLLVSGVLAWLCHRAAGPTLGVFLGGLAVVPLIGPPLVLASATGVRRIWALAGMMIGVGAVWWWTGRKAELTFVEWLACVTVAWSYAAAVAGIASAMERLRVNDLIASAIGVVLGCAWLTWPIWMAPWLSGERGERIVSALVAANPVFAIDGALRRPFPTPWAQHRYAYQWTNIGDDIRYSVPTSIWPTVGLHAAIALVCFGAPLLRLRKLSVSPPSADAPFHRPAGQ